MASLEHEKVAKPVEEPEVVVVVVPPTETVEPEKGTPPSDAVCPAKLAVVEVVLRFLLFVGSVTAVVVMVTSKQTEMIPTPFPGVLIPYSSNFTDSPSFIYFVAAFSVAGLYSIITTLANSLELLKPGSCKQLLSHFVILDVLLLGIAAAAVGAAGGVGYIGLKGNTHSRWMKVCDRYDTFCQHLAGSIAAGLFASIVLVLLILLSIFTLSRKIPK